MYDALRTRLGASLLLGTFAAAALAGCVKVPTSPSGLPLDLRAIEFFQLDWRDATGEFTQANTLWGEVRWTYDPPLSLTHYLSIQASAASGADVWIVHNLPLFDTDSGAKGVRESVYFDLASLGHEAGEDVPSITYAVSLGRTAMTQPVLDSEPVEAVVTDSLRTSCGLPEELTGEGPGGPGAPDNALNAGAQQAAAAERDIRPVQEAASHCMAGSLARSIDWLNREHNLGMNKNGQQIYDDLVGKGVSTPPADGDWNKARADWVKAKDAYAKEKSNNKIVTKVWDGGNYVDPVAGVNEEGPGQVSFEDWIKREIATEDVEVAFYYPGNSHIVTVVGVTLDANGHVTGIKYRDDEAQGDNANGDSAVKNAPVTKKADGTYTFGGANQIVFFAVSESVV